MTTSRLHLSAGLALALVTALIAAFTAPAIGAAPVAKPTSCNIASMAHKLGATTVSSLKVTGTTCAMGITVVKAFHACRTANGKSGRCVRKVLGYACNEIRTNLPTQISANVTCGNGTARVTHHYVQNL